MAKKQKSPLEMPPRNGAVLERRVWDWFRQYKILGGFILVVLVFLVLGPLAFFWMCPSKAKAWAETVETVATTVAILGSAGAIIAWLAERRDRATNVLLMLEEEFRREQVADGRDLIDKRDLRDTFSDHSKADAMLRFYVLLHEVHFARQVDQCTLSTCFRYWLALFYRADREEFRNYVKTYFPTLREWLLEDIKPGSDAFFRPHEFWDKKNIAEEFQQKLENNS